MHQENNKQTRQTVGKGLLTIIERSSSSSSSNSSSSSSSSKGGIYIMVFAEGYGGHVLVTEFRGMTLNCLFCTDVLYGHSISSPSLTLPTNTTLSSSSIVCVQNDHLNRRYILMEASNATPTVMRWLQLRFDFDSS